MEAQLQSQGLKKRIGTPAVPVNRPLLMVAARTVCFALVQLMFVLIYRVTWQESVAWWPFFAVAANLICFVLLSIFAKAEGKSYLDIIHFEKSKLLKDIKQIWWVFIAAGVAGFIGLSGVGYFIYGSLTPPDQMIQPLPLWAAVAAFILFPLTNALVEVPTYMGFCLPRFEAVWKSTGKALVLPCFFLAFQHFTLPVILSDVTYMIWHFLGMIPLALAVGFIYIKIRRLVPIMIVHYIMDVMTVVGVLTLSM